MGIILTGSNQASYNFDLGGDLAPRPKNLFFVRLVRAENDGPWKTMGFLVKSTDRPEVEVQTETLNQYNKKRIIHTGVSYSPIRMTVYDTADSRMLQLWNNYSSYYFGDFRHSKNRSDWDYDATAPDFKNAGGEFGFAPSDANLFYFSAIEIYQVFRKQFVQWTLINPRITNFVPDAMEYSDSEPSTFNLTFAYEAVFYENGGQPSTIDSNGWLKEQFATRNLGGLVNEVPGSSNSTATPSKADPATVPKTSAQPVNTWTMPPVDAMGNFTGAPAVDNSGPTNQAAGALKNQGNYDFGSKQQSANGKSEPSAAQKDAAQKSSGVNGSPANSAAKTAAQTNTAPQDHIKNTSSGVQLSPAAIAQENKTRPPTSQIGVNGNNSAKPMIKNDEKIYQSENKAIQQQINKNVSTSDMATQKADQLGLPQGDLTAQFEAGVITSVSRGGKTVDLYPSLSAQEKAKVDAVRKFRAQMGR